MPSMLCTLTSAHVLTCKSWHWRAKPNSDARLTVRVMASQYTSNLHPHANGQQLMVNCLDGTTPIDVTNSTSHCSSAWLAYVNSVHVTHSSMALKGFPANSPMASVSATVLKDRSPPAAIGTYSSKSQLHEASCPCALFMTVQLLCVMGGSLNLKP